MKPAAAIYARVSTDDQRTIRQQEELKELVNTQGYTLAPEHIYTESVSGFSTKEQRFALIRMMEEVSQSNVKMIFLSEISRLSRDPQLGRKVMEELAEQGIGMYFQNIGQCSINPDGSRNPFFHIMFQILIENAKLEADTMKVRSKSGMRQAAKEGKIHGGLMLAYGFKRENQRMVIDEAEAAVVRDIFQMVLNGIGSTTIAAILNERKIPTRVTKIKAGKLEHVHKLWVDGVISSMLRNRIYMGVKSFMDLKLSVPAIIEPHIFNQVQQTLTSRFNQKISQTKYLYLLNKLCKCGKCGLSYYGRFKPDGSKDKYYMCLSRRYRNNCGNRGISIEGLESCVWSIITRDTNLKEYLKNSSIQLKSVEKELTSLKQKLGIEQKFMVQKKKEIEKLLEVYLKDGIDQEDYIDRNIKLKKQLDTYINKVETLKQTIDAKTSVQLEYTDFKTYFKLVKEIHQDRYRMNEILPNILDKVTVNAFDENIFLISVFYKGVSTPHSVIFNKRTMKYYWWKSKFPLKYDKNGILKQLPRLNPFNFDKVKAHDANLVKFVPINKLQRAV